MQIAYEARGKKQLQGPSRENIVNEREQVSHEEVFGN